MRNAMKSLKDSKNSNICLSHGGGANEKNLLKEHVMSKLSRKDLEDKYYKEYEKNIALKKQLNVHEQRIRQQNTKLSRLAEQLKNKDYIYFLACKYFEESNTQRNEGYDENEKQNIVPNRNKNILKKPSHSDQDSEAHKKQTRVNFSLDLPLEDIAEQDSVESNESEDYSNDSDELRKSPEPPAKEVVIDKIEPELKAKDDTKWYAILNELKQIKDSERANEKKSEKYSTSTQTSNNYIDDLSTVKESLAQELAEEHFKVLELKNQVNTMKLSQSIIKKVDERLERLQMFRDSNGLILSDASYKAINVEKIEDIDETRINDFRLAELVEANNGMKSKISTLMEEIGTLMDKLKSYEDKKTADNIVDNKSILTPKGVPDSTDSECDKEDNELQQQIDSDVPQIVESHNENVPQTESKTDENENELKDVRKNEVDDATYDLSKHSNDSSSVDEDLSDGEIPQKGDSISDQEEDSLKKLEIKRDNAKNNVLPPEEALKILTDEMNECERLLNMSVNKNTSSKKQRKKVVKSEPKDILSIETQTDLRPNSGVAQLILNIFEINLNEQILTDIDEDLILISWRYNDCEIIHSPIEAKPIIKLQFETAVNFQFDDKSSIENEKIKILISKVHDKEHVDLVQCNLGLAKALSFINHNLHYELDLIRLDNHSEVMGCLKCYYRVTFADDAELLETQNEEEAIIKQDEDENLENINQPAESKEESTNNIVELDSSSDSDPPSESDLKKSSRTKLRNKSNDQSVDDFKNYKLIADIKGIESSNEATNNEILAVTVLWIKFNENAELLTDNNINLIYIEYLLLPENNLEWESKSSAKPSAADEPAYYNFKKEFLIGGDKNYLNKLNLLNIVNLNRDETENYIPFTIISEPSEDLSGLEECKELGWAKLCISDLLDQVSDNDCAEIHLNVFSTNENTPIGELAVQIDGVNLLRDLKNDDQYCE